ncbi:MAG: methyltransferase domain-containing protein [Candidatus Latescibacteria bacterium]|nr:methyltransferase domain-containing protein [Candidatus Latescibacterota bacterium]
MDEGAFEETRNFWNRVADDWRIQVGDDGDPNRILCTDPVLWQFAGDVSGLTVLDAGCGTGYLSKKLCDHGAHVTGIDFSERMIEIARTHNPAIDFRVDSCSELRTLDIEHFDLVIANHVIMDTPDLQGTMTAFNRVLRIDGVAVLVFSHPCFRQDRATVSRNGDEVNYSWNFPYFESRQCVSPPWAHFTSEFIWFHRPLSDYWKAFLAAGFVVVDFEEPRSTGRKTSQNRPYSVAFKLQKKNAAP